GLGLAAEGREDAQLSIGGKVAPYSSLLGGAPGELLLRFEAGFPQLIEGPVHVAFGLLQGLLALHHGEAGFFAKFHDLFGVHRHFLLHFLKGYWASLRETWVSSGVREGPRVKAKGLKLAGMPGLVKGLASLTR